MTEPGKKKDGWKENLRTVAIAVLLAVVFRSFLYEPFHIPSGSMKSNLLIGDYLFVSKFSYGYSRYSFPFGLKLFDGRLGSGDRPERGDVVVFRKPREESIDYIKRVMGLPGDTIQVLDGVVHINGEALPRERMDDFQEFDPYRSTYVSIPRYMETLPGGKRYAVLDETRSGAVDNTPEYTVPEGHYFMMGDNRDNSTDSRYMDDLGFVPEENLVGRAVIIVASGSGEGIRWDRFFTWIP